MYKSHFFIKELYMQSKNYITIQGWMRSELNLKGNDLLVYAIIYGFSQTENQRFTGSLQYLADWCGATKQGIQKNLKNLIDKDLIEKFEVVQNNVKFCQYATKLHSGIQLSCNNNISNNQEDNKSKSSIINNTTVDSKKFLGSANKKPRESLYTKVQSSVKALSTDVAIQNALLDFFDLQIEIYREEGKQYYFNIWKSRLNKLQTDFDKKDWLKVIQQSTSQGWKSFYPLRDYSKQSTQKEKAWNKNVSCDKYTEEEEEEQERWREEMRRKGVQVDF